MRIPLQTDANRLLTLLLVLDVVEAVLAVAVLAELAVRKAIAVQLQALRFGAVAVLATRPLGLRLAGRRAGRSAQRLAAAQRAAAVVDHRGGHNVRGAVQQLVRNVERIGEHRGRAGIAGRVQRFAIGSDNGAT